MITVTDEAYEQQVLANPRPVLLVFGTFEDLGSRILGPILLETEQALAGRMDIAIADVARCPKAAESWGVGDRLPVMVLLNNGVLERVLHGVRSNRRIVADVEPFLP
jgi:thioredoxin-like negative regulator of GroEL